LHYPPHNHGMEATIGLYSGLVRNLWYDATGTDSSLARGASELQAKDCSNPAPRRQWVLMLSGAIAVEVSDRSWRRFGPGDLLLVAHIAGVGHTTRATGDPPLEGLFVPVE